MKLYATMQSERATKGQGGNKFIIVTLFIGGKNLPKKAVTITLERDEVQKGYGVLFRVNHEVTNDTAGRTIFIPDEIKGKRQ